MFTYSLNLKLKTDRNFFGPALSKFTKIQQTGSLNLAAKEMKMSYNKACADCAGS